MTLTLNQKQEHEAYAQALLFFKDKYPLTFTTMSRVTFENILGFCSKKELLSAANLAAQYMSTAEARALVLGLNNVLLKHNIATNSFASLKSEKKEQGKLEFYQLKVNRNVNGLSIYMKSPDLENFIRKTTSRPDTVDMERNLMRSPNWVGVCGYYQPNHTLFTQRYNWGGALMVGNQANLAFLCTKGLGDGVTVNLNGLYTNAQIQEFMTKFKYSVGELYREFMKPFAQELIVHYEEL